MVLFLLLFCIPLTVLAVYPGAPFTANILSAESPAMSLKADKVIGIPWGATEEQVKSVMKQRPSKTWYNPDFAGKKGDDRWVFYGTPYADFNEGWTYIHFYQDKMWQVQISWRLHEDEVMERFNAVKHGLTARYGAPTSEKGKYLDSFVYWDLGGDSRGYAVNIQIRKNTIPYIEGYEPWKDYPFRVYVTYYNQSVASIILSGSDQLSKDY